jgi:type II secretory pathway component PulF
MKSVRALYILSSIALFAVIVYGAAVLPHAKKEAVEMNIELGALTSSLIWFSTNTGFFLLPILYLAICIGIFLGKGRAHLMQWGYGLLVIACILLVSMFITDVALLLLLPAIPVTCILVRRSASKSPGLGSASA